MLRSAFLSVALVLLMATSALAGSANEFTFIGKLNDPKCLDAQHATYPHGARIIQSMWVTGIGLPDEPDESNLAEDPPLFAEVPEHYDGRYGLLLVKSQSSANCSWSGVTFAGFGTFIVNANTRLGFDYVGVDYAPPALPGPPPGNYTRSLCSADNPRYEISYLVGTTPRSAVVRNCSLGTKTQAPQDPGWTRIRWNPTVAGGGAFPGLIPIGARITAVRIIFDEEGLAVIDNILINGKLQASESKTAAP
jgi:hypothetical protein